MIFHLNRTFVFGRSGASLLTKCKKSPKISEQIRTMALLKKIDDKHSVESKTEYKAPIKFTQSPAYLDYRATDSFYGGDNDSGLPKSHNLMLASTGIFATFYLIFLRDDIDNDGGKNLIKPVHETVPSVAIPMLRSTIVQNKRMGLNTEKLELLVLFLAEPGDE